MENKCFYVYRHRRADNNKIFYVGKGKYNSNPRYKNQNYQRAYDKVLRSDFWKNIIKKTDYTVEIVAENLCEEEAFELEILLISEYGRRCSKKGFLCNLTDGGDGASGYKFTPEQKENLSVSKSKLKKDKLKLKNGLEEEERGLNKCISIYTLDKIFIETMGSAKEISEKYNLNRSNIATAIKNKTYKVKNYLVTFCNSLIPDDFKVVDKNKEKEKPVYLYDLDMNFIRRFESTKACANFLGCKRSEVTRCCNGHRSRIKNYKVLRELMLKN